MMSDRRKILLCREIGIILVSLVLWIILGQLFRAAGTTPDIMQNGLRTIFFEQKNPIYNVQIQQDTEVGNSGQPVIQAESGILEGTGTENARMPSDPELVGTVSDNDTAENERPEPDGEEGEDGLPTHDSETDEPDHTVSDNDIDRDMALIAFEDKNPVVRRKVEKGTPVENIGLPEKLRAIFYCEEKEKTAEFVQIKPDAGTVETSGYYAPENENKLRENGERVIYTWQGRRDEFLMAMLSGNETPTGEREYRLYGAVGESAPGWYACDKSGKITGRMQEIAVSWDVSGYDAQAGGEYQIPAVLGGDFEIYAETPYVEIEVMAVECTCGAPEFCRPWEHADSCSIYEPVQCMCWEKSQEEETEKEEQTDEEMQTDRGIHNESNADCPLHQADIIQLYRPDGVTLVWGMIEDLELFLEKGFIIPEELKVHYAMEVMAAVSGANDTAQNEYMDKHTPASGNAGGTDYSSKRVLSGEWLNYVNNVWRKKALDKEGKGIGFKWAGTQTGVVPWNGGAVSIMYSSADGAYHVRSAEELRYALESLGNRGGGINQSSQVYKIKLEKDIDLNGHTKKWDPIIRPATASKIELDGNGHTIYNLGICYVDNKKRCTFVSCGNGSVIKNLAFSNAKIVGKAAELTDWDGGYSIDDEYGHHPAWLNKTSLLGATDGDTLESILVKDSLIYGGFWVAVLDGGGYGGKVTNCYVDSCFVYGHSHVAGLTTMIHDKQVSNSYVKDTLIVGKNGDIGGFTSCGGGRTEAESYYKECFVSNAEIYAGLNGGGFIGVDSDVLSNKFESCFSSGILWGYGPAAGNNVAGAYGGFVGGISVPEKGKMKIYSKCYSTMHVLAWNKEATEMGGFYGRIAGVGGEVRFADCYAAGEVGDYLVDLSLSQTNNKRYFGGFGGRDHTGKGKYWNCYYDKQTTAMREWALGDKQSNGNENIAEGYTSNIRGVMTSGKSTSKNGAGLATSYGQTVTGNAKGFAGFLAFKYLWKQAEDQYPEIMNLSDSYKWKGSDGQPSNEIAQTVSNASKASVQTVMLDTWEKGYNWGSYGAGTKSEKAFNSSYQFQFEGSVYTYDTVRDITTDIKKKSDAYWSDTNLKNMPVTITGVTSSNQGKAVEIDKNGNFNILRPGQSWFEYATSLSTGASVGRRPIRLISFMKVEAGQDRTVTSGNYYSHASGDRYQEAQQRLYYNRFVSPYFAMANEIGRDRSAYTIKYYPDYVRGDTGAGCEYSNVPLDPVTNYPLASGWLSGSSSDKTKTKVYTEIYRTGTQIKVKYDSVGMNRWNAKLPMRTDAVDGQSYTITYYWLLNDGRYVSDSKTVKIEPAKYTLSMEVINRDDTSRKVNDAVQLGAYQRINDIGRNMVLTDGSRMTEIPYGSMAVAAWKPVDGYAVTGIRIELYDENMRSLKDRNGTILGIETVFKENWGIQSEDGTIRKSKGVEAGTSIALKGFVNPYYINSNVESGYELNSSSSIGTRTYTVQETGDGIYYLAFDKKTNNNVRPSTGLNRDLLDMCYNVKVTLFVEPTNTLVIEKKLDATYTDRDKEFAIDVDIRTGPRGEFGTKSGYGGEVLYVKDGEVVRSEYMNYYAPVNTLHLKGGEKAVIKNIPRIYETYTVKEQEASSEGYVVNYTKKASNGSSGSSESGIEGGFFSGSKVLTEEVTIYNTEKYADEFRIEKNVIGLEEGSRVDKDRYYKIDIILSDKEDFSDNTLTGEFSYSKGETGGTLRFEQGKTTIELKDGESICIKGLPCYYFKVEEQTESAEGFDVRYYRRINEGSGEDENSGQLQYEQAVEIEVQNNEQPIPYYELPNTGGMGTYGYTTGGAAIMMTALLLLIKYWRTQKAHHG